MDWKVGQRAAPFDCYSGILRYAPTIKAIRWNDSAGAWECQFNPPTRGNMDWDEREFPNNDPWSFWFDLDYVANEEAEEKDLDKTDAQICAEVDAEYTRLGHSLFVIKNFGLFYFLKQLIKR